MARPQLEVISSTGSRAMVYKIDRDIWPVYHYHPEYDILLSLKDHRGRFISGDHTGPLERGTLIMNGPNIPHALHTGLPDEEDWSRPSLAVIQFSEDSLGREFLERQEMRPIREFLHAARWGFEFVGDTRERAAEIILGMRDLGELERLFELFRLLRLFAESSERRVLASPAYAPSLRERDITRLDRVVRHLHAEMARLIRLETVARVAGLTPKSFCRFFRANTGKTLVEYVNAMRVGEACRLLVETGRPVTEIAFAVGFNNLSNFNRRFRELKGLSPREFRLRAAPDARRQHEPMPEVRVFG
ncbi:MAG: helix-turn-helix domain-containing protein [Verrucomicrobiales bacterium]|nr:helix-turn-helix domain-containing protein [Verrucomicrobiales bacterium]